MVSGDLCKHEVDVTDAGSSTRRANSENKQRRSHSVVGILMKVHDLNSLVA
jgi:hypothetical protein